ncbi:MAG: hypothetical protein RR782_06790 [Clostridium sp.]
MEEIKKELVQELEKLKFFLQQRDVNCDKEGVIKNLVITHRKL